MGLAAYKKKRNFEKTPEPRGKAHQSPTGTKYLIQKHDASRLHYDFRIELDGVLKSWAVPKGPSLDPSEKRLAVHVEDHPLEYGNFEGTIPKGQYGGGTVLLWDRGEWEALGDARKDYHEGKLKFRIYGEKLRGTWMLLRLKAREGEEEDRNWLLIKEKDEEGRPAKQYNVTKKEPLSVATGRDLDEIAAAQDAVWQSNRDEDTAKTLKKQTKKAAAARTARSAPPAAKKEGKRAAAKAKAATSASPPAVDPSLLKDARKAAQPESFQPQLATLVKSVPQGDQWLHELKFDGYRMLCFKQGARVRLITRNGKDWTAKFAPVAEALAALPVDQAVLDGEVVVLRKDGTTDFQALQNAMKASRKANFVYYVFDLPHCGGYALSGTPLLERKQLLEQLLAAHPHPMLRYSQHIQGQGTQVYEHACQFAMEGVISKRADAAYEQRRSKSWVKTKCLKRQEFVVAGYTDPSGARKHFGALLLAYYDDKQHLVYCGRVGTGFTDASLKRLYATMKPLEQQESPLKTRLRGAEARGVHWLEPRLVAEVEFTEWTEEGILRHPSFKGLREDKAAEEVGRELAAPLADVERELSGKADHSNGRRGKGSQQRGESRMSEPPVDGKIAGIKLSNPEKILYPDQGLTKLNLARYYEEIADWVLPYVVNRPLSLVRCPQGSEEKCFFQKHVKDSTQSAIHGVKVKERSGTSEYIAISDLSGLISLVQMGVLEIHPWGSREDKVEYPDQIIFDLDPDPEVTWADVVHAAQELKALLESFDYTTFIKTSGGKGLHIVMPVTRRSDWDEVKAFAKAVADEMTRRAPDRYLATMSKAKRKGKIFVDYLRNGRGATSVAAYSTRARAGAPVSAPIFWEELTEDLSPQQYTLENMPERLRGLKKDPWAGFFETRQSITAKAKKALRL